jgi:hypothetical protein
MSEPARQITKGFDDQGDICLGFFREMYTAGHFEFPREAKVLEVGCAEIDWLTPMKTARPDLHLTGVDQRRHPPRPGANSVGHGRHHATGLVCPATFDAIVAVSVIEHVGIGRYEDPRDEDGDIKAMANLKLWLKPTGFLYMDVPWRPEGPSTPFRQYNDADLAARVTNGWTVTAREHFYPNHPDAPYVAMVLRP